MRILKKISLLVLIFMLFTVSNVYADTLGSVDIAFQNKKAAHISFSIYKIGDCIDSSLMKYSLSDDFYGLDCYLNDIETASDCENIIKKSISYIQDYKVKPYKVECCDDTGHLSFTQLETGLYVIIQNELVDNFEAESVLIQMPRYNGQSFVYDINAKPKYSDLPDEGDDVVIKVKTGDDQDMSPYLITCFISAFVLFLLIILMKSDRKNVK